MATDQPIISAEAWMPVVRFEGIYEVSSLGQVRSVIDRFGSHAGRVLRRNIIKSGYAMVHLYRSPQDHKYMRVCRIVATAFHGPCPKGMQCNHKNGDKADDRADNLEWVTPSQNVRHRFDVLGIQNPRGSRHQNSKLTEDQVREIRQLAASGVTWQNIAGRFKVSKSCVMLIVTRRNWKHID